MVGGQLVVSLGWRYGYLLLITVAVAATLVPLGPIFCRELREIRIIRANQQNSQN